MSGQVSVKRVGSAGPVALKVNSTLNNGDIVHTAPRAKATVLFGDGSQLRLNGNTTIEITSVSLSKGKRGLFRAISGEIWSRMRPGRGGKTPSATLGVAGTEFDIIVQEDGTTTLTVINGAVEFFNEAGDVVVRTSQRSTARPGQAPTTPVTIANEDFNIEWTQDLNRALLPREKTFLARPISLQELQQLQQQAAGKPDDWQAQRDYGDALFESGRYQDAALIYENAARLAPAQVSIATRLAYALLELGRMEEAKTTLLSAHAQAAQDAQVLIALAWLTLEQDAPDKAEAWAQQAVAAAKAGPETTEAQLLLGISRLRQPAKTADALSALQAALATPQNALHYQAHAWLAQAELAQNHIDDALKSGSSAVKAAPASALAHASLAQVAFFANQLSLAQREAKVALRLNPRAVAALVALGQSQLAQGDVDNAAHTAARAVAQDEQLPVAHYLLGVAEAGRRDYVHAERALRETLQLAPDFVPAASALARVYNRMGRREEAERLLTALLPRYGENDMLRGALGEVYYEQGRYAQGMAEFEKAIQLNPSSALYQAGLARLALDANRLSEAVHAGQKAVQMAPTIAGYHAILGLAYQRSRLPSQAEREFRTALALDPQNALSLVQLGFANEEGDPRIAQRTSSLTFAQGFLLNPAISRELLRGGVDSEIEPRGGPDNHGATLLHRDIAARGKLHFFGGANHDKDGGDRSNSDLSQTVARQDTTLVQGRATLYAHLLHRRNRSGLPGQESAPALDDRISLRFNEGIFAWRQRLGGGAHLWAGVFANHQSEGRTNPGDDASFARSFSFLTASITGQNTTTEALEPEVRLDWPLRRLAGQASILSLGATRTRTQSTRMQSLVRDNGTPQPDTGSAQLEQEIESSLFYAQWAHQVSEATSFVGQLRHQRVNRAAAETGKLGVLSIMPVSALEKSYWLPSVILNHRLNQSNVVRLIASRRVTEVTPSVFAPTATLITTEGETLPSGLPDPAPGGDLQTVELEAEHYDGGGLWKLFAFHTSARSLIYDFSGFANPSFTPNGLQPNMLVLDRVRRTGAGVRYERPLGKRWFGHALASYNRTVNQTANASFDGQIAPYQPRFVAQLGLNYLDASGNKIGVSLHHNGAFFADTGLANPAGRPRFPSKTTIDLELAREPSVRAEVFLRISNLFNTRQIIFNGIPVNGRRIQAGVTRRF